MVWVLLLPSIQAKYDDIKKVLKEAANGPMKGILAYTEDQVSAWLKFWPKLIPTDTGQQMHFTNRMLGGTDLQIYKCMNKLSRWWEPEIWSDPHGLFSYFHS